MLTFPTLRRTGSAGIRRARAATPGGAMPAETAETADGARPPSVPHRVMSITLWILVIAAVVLLWPSWLGGATRLTIVGGHSMESTYRLGDLLVVREGGANDAGDIVVFRVPEGPGRGTLVVHRIVERRPDGRIVTQGDNRERPDDWVLHDDDVVGHPVLRVPYAGKVVYALRAPWALAVLGGVAFMILFWPRRRDDPSDEAAVAEQRLQAVIDDVGATAAERRLDALLDELLAETTQARPTAPDDPTAPLPRYVALEAEPPSGVTAELMAEAEAWLDAQLAELTAAR